MINYKFVRLSPKKKKNEKCVIKIRGGMCVARVRILNKTTIPSFDNLSRIWLFERKYKKLSIKKKKEGEIKSKYPEMLKLSDFLFKKL